MRISEWATKFGISVVEPEAALNAAAWPTGNKFIVKDLFTTRDGHWYESSRRDRRHPALGGRRLRKPNQARAGQRTASCAFSSPMARPDCKRNSHTGQTAAMPGWRSMTASRSRRAGWPTGARQS